MVHWWVLISFNPAPAFFFLFPLLFCEIYFPLSEKESLRDLTRVGKNPKLERRGKPSRPPPKKEAEKNSERFVARFLHVSNSTEIFFSFVFVVVVVVALARLLQRWTDFVILLTTGEFAGSTNSLQSVEHGSADEMSRALLAHNQCTKYK
jgi:hypothetical protein